MTDGRVVATDNLPSAHFEHYSCYRKWFKGRCTLLKFDLIEEEERKNINLDI